MHWAVSTVVMFAVLFIAVCVVAILLVRYRGAHVATGGYDLPAVPAGTDTINVIVQRCRINIQQNNALQAIDPESFKNPTITPYKRRLLIDLATLYAINKPAFRDFQATIILLIRYGTVTNFIKQTNYYISRMEYNLNYINKLADYVATIKIIVEFRDKTRGLDAFPFNIGTRAVPIIFDANDMVRSFSDKADAVIRAEEERRRRAEEERWRRAEEEENEAAGQPEPQRRRLVARGDRLERLAGGYYRLSRGAAAIADVLVAMSDSRKPEDAAARALSEARPVPAEPPATTLAVVFDTSKYPLPPDAVRRALADVLISGGALSIKAARNIPPVDGPRWAGGAWVFRRAGGVDARGVQGARDAMQFVTSVGFR